MAKAVEEKTLVLMRHAHRDKPMGRQADNGISRKGKRQAEALLDHYNEIYHGAHPYIVSSPKVRCVETVFPIAQLEKTEIQLSALLDEQRPSRPKESDAAFRRRVNRFCKWWKSNDAPPLTLACSHGDWLPLCIELLIGAEVDLDKGGWAEIVMEDRKPRLRWVLQRLG